MALVWHKKSARIRRNIGEQKTFDLNLANGHWKSDLTGLSNIHAPYRNGLPKKTEVAFYIVDKKLDGDKPYLTVQYVEAKR